MQCNVILAGVGGQGILTIAGLLSRAAVRRELFVKQSEVHGMSQRGGAVQAHVRIADRPVHSELIPLGEADLILAVEPLEALRYVQYLRPAGTILASSQPVTNISNYPDLSWVRQTIAAATPRAVVIDSAKLAREAGTARSENMVMLGAASRFLPLSPDDLLAVMDEAFDEKGPKVREQNRKAFDLGRRAVADEQGADAAAGDPPARRAAAELIESVRRDGRARLYEHEVYRLLELAGSAAPPAHRFIPADASISTGDLATFGGDRVVLKAVSPDVAHKSEAGGVKVVARDLAAVQAAAEVMRQAYAAAGAKLAGALLVQYVDHAPALGGELFVGLRQSREFGPILAAGFGGVQAEFLAEKLRPGEGTVMAPALRTSGERFLAHFRRSSAYAAVTGKARGAGGRVDDAALLRCFSAFCQLARWFADPRTCRAGIEEIEVNPFAAAGSTLVPLDGRGLLGELSPPPAARPPEQVRRLLAPESIAVLGVSSKRANFGRIILNNIQKSGFSGQLTVVKEGDREIDGAPCVPSITALPAPTDLLVASASAEQVPQLVEQMLAARGRIGSAVLISGGVGEREGTEGLMRDLHRRIDAARTDASTAAAGPVPVFLGTNSMGVQNLPGRYDTFFIPPEKLPPPSAVPPRPLALVSQSGAFILARSARLTQLRPLISVSLGNQLDVTAADITRALLARQDVRCVGVYLEGFNPLDGLAFADAVAEARAAGKTVVFYKAGRTPAGRTAAQGHTASLAGDWDACAAAITQAGGIVATSFAEYERLVELVTALDGKRLAGRRIAAVSNAGYETVAMADAILGAGYALELPPLPEPLRARLSAFLAERSLTALVNLRNPLDMTPMTDDADYERIVGALLESDAYDAVVVGVVPMTPQLLTTPDEVGRLDSVAHRLVRLFRASAKPMVVVIDAAAPYGPLAAVLRDAGVPVCARADEAVATLGRILADV